MKKVWYKEGTNIIHREDGPALEFASGSKCWYKEDKLHRLDGPACEYANGTKYWYVEGIFYRNVNSVEELIIKMIIE